MPEMTAEQIGQRAFELNLIDEQQLQHAWGEFGRRDVPADDFAQYLLRRELLTNFQFERMLKGETGGYFYGKYKVLYLIAGGSFARVYRAENKETKRVVALKVLRSRYSGDPTQVDHFCREGMVGVKLRHPNIVPVYEVESKGRTHFLVMEFVEGHSLRDFVKLRKRLTPIEATKIAIDIASGLSYALERGVSHRDLKLTNVLVSSKGQAKLVDFGLAADNADNDEAGDVINQRTIDYAGLERATGVRRDDMRSDIYFLGVMYYAMLYGKSPLVETRDKIVRMSRSRYFDVTPIYRAMPEIPRVVATVVNTAMQLEPDLRYQTPGEMLVDLRIALERLAAGDVAAASTAGDEGATDGRPGHRVRLASTLQAEGARQNGLMIVESNGAMQDVFRDHFKKAGYRVLLIGDPNRAAERFTDNSKPAQCVLFCTSELGERAVQAFEDFAEGAITRAIPAVLLLDPRYRALAARVQGRLCEHRIIAPMPIKMKKLQELLVSLIHAHPVKA